eukprot:4323611-Ditylum_brightwellii.AAC.1
MSTMRSSRTITGIRVKDLFGIMADQLQTLNDDCLVTLLQDSFLIVWIGIENKRTYVQEI